MLGSVHFDFISQGSVFLFKLIEGRSHKSYQLGPASLVVSPRLKTEQQDISSVLPCWGSTDVLKRNIGLNILVRSKPIARELRNLGNYIGSLINFKRPLLILKSGIRSIGSTFGGSSRLLYFGVLLDNFSELTTHDFQLSVVNAQRNDTNDRKYHTGNDGGTFYPSKLSSKLCGGILLWIGVALALLSHFMLLWGGWRYWRLGTRLVFGITGWTVAVGLIWHGTALFLGID